MHATSSTGRNLVGNGSGELDVHMGLPPNTKLHGKGSSVKRVIMSPHVIAESKTKMNLGPKSKCCLDPGRVLLKAHILCFSSF